MDPFIIRIPGCSRGIFGLKSFELPKRPESELIHDTLDLRQGNSISNSQQTKDDNNETVELVAGFNYKANLNSPLGRELSLTQGEKLRLISRDNEFWWIAENQNKEQGYVPKRYLIIVEKEVKGLPWLQDKEPPTPVLPPVAGGPVKVYKPSYDHPELDVKAGSQTNQHFTCTPCGKQLNSLQQWNLHINSKRHIEIMEEDFE